MSFDYIEIPRNNGDSCSFYDRIALMKKDGTHFELTDHYRLGNSLLKEFPDPENDVSIFWYVENLEDGDNLDGTFLFDDRHGYKTENPLVKDVKERKPWVQPPLMIDPLSYYDFQFPSVESITDPYLDEIIEENFLSYDRQYTVFLGFNKEPTSLIKKKRTCQRLVLSLNLDSINIQITSVSEDQVTILTMEGCFHNSWAYQNSFSMKHLKNFYGENMLSRYDGLFIISHFVKRLREAPTYPYFYRYGHYPESPRVDEKGVLHIPSVLGDIMINPLVIFENPPLMEETSTLLDYFGNPIKTDISYMDIGSMTKTILDINRNLI